MVLSNMYTLCALLGLVLLFIIILLQIILLTRKQPAPTIDVTPISQSFAGEFRQNRMELDAKLTAMSQTQSHDARANREEQTKALNTIAAKIDMLTRDVTHTVTTSLQNIQKDNQTKLDEIRRTVDEKLTDTLNRRLGESFRLVSTQLESVQKGLGEVSGLMTGVDDLRNTLTGSKTKGMIGEWQLKNLIEDTLTSDEYDENCKTKKGSDKLVEYAVRLPYPTSKKGFIWLPVDSKFPTADFSSIQEAYNAMDKAALSKARKSLEAKVISFAKDIQGKYIEPPETTEFGVMFIPFESIYAEIMSIPGLFDTIQNEYHVIITGPTTLRAMLGMVKMRFQCLTVEKRTQEIWQTLGAVKTEFNKFGGMLEKAKEKIDAASKELDQDAKRTRALERKLKNVEALSEAQARQILSLNAADLDVDEED